MLRIPHQDRIVIVTDGIDSGKFTRSRVDLVLEASGVIGVLLVLSP